MKVIYSMDKDLLDFVFASLDEKLKRSSKYMYQKGVSLQECCEYRVESEKKIKRI